MRLEFTSGLDPKRFAVNIRFLNNRSLPPDVRAAKEELAEEAQLHMATQNPGWRQRATDFYVVALDFIMTDRRNDIDGPSKRVLDAIFEGAGLSDSRVQELYLRRYHGSQPGIAVSITQCRGGDYDIRDYRKGREREEPVGEDPADF